MNKLEPQTLYKRARLDGTSPPPKQPDDLTRTLTLGKQIVLRPENHPKPNYFGVLGSYLPALISAAAQTLIPTVLSQHGRNCNTLLITAAIAQHH